MNFWSYLGLLCFILAILLKVCAIEVKIDQILESSQESTGSEEQ